MSQAAPLGTEARRGALAAGVLVGERFRLKSLAAQGQDDGCDSYWAEDTQGGGSTLLRLVSVDAGLRPLLEADVRAAMGVAHDNLARIAGAGTFGNAIYVAEVVEDGHTLRHLVDTQRAQGRPVGLAAAHTILGHVAAGLGAGLRGQAHGCIQPEAIWITRGGRIKLGNLGLGRALSSLARRGGPAGAPGGLYLAPERLRGGEPTPAGDVYALGAVLYELLTAAPAAPPLRPPSQSVVGLPAAVDGLIARAMAPDPSARFASAAELAAALGALAGGAPAAAAAPEPGRPTVGKPFSISEVTGGLSGEAERWLIQKDKLDFGPFSLQQVMAQLEQGVFEPDHLIVDMDSGARVMIKDHPQLGESAVKAARKREQARRERAEHATAHVERKKSRATSLILGSVLVAVAGLVALFLVNRQNARNAALEQRVTDDEVDAFLKNVKLSFAAPKRPTARRPGAAGGSRADEFSADLNLGDVSKGGGDEILSEAAINKVMMANYRRLVGCLMGERQRNPRVDAMDLEFVVRGTGKVSAVKVNGTEKGPFPRCVLDRMRAFPFPTFNGSRTIASWSMSLQ